MSVVNAVGRGADARRLGHVIGRRMAVGLFVALAATACSDGGSATTGADQTPTDPSAGARSEATETTHTDPALTESTPADGPQRDPALSGDGSKGDGPETTSLGPTYAPDTPIGPGFIVGTDDPVPPPSARPAWLDEGPTPDPSAALHVDCDTGDDANPGTRQEPLATLAAVNRAQLAVGADIAVRGRCESQQLRVTWDGTAADPVVIDGYGATIESTGAQIGGGALVEVEGDHVQIWGLRLEGRPAQVLTTGRACPGSSDSAYGTGYVVGVRLAGDHGVVAHADISGTYAGVLIAEAAEGATVARSYLHHNDIITPTGRDDVDDGNDDAGAIGVLIHGSGAEVAWNYFRQNRACSPDYFVDGSAVEIFNGSNNIIHHNLSVNDHVFTELGRSADHSTPMTGNTFEANRYISAYGGHDSGSPSGERFLVTRGSAALGPVLHTVAINNRVTILGSQGDAFVCIACNADTLTLGGNEISVTRHDIWYDSYGGGAYAVVDAASPEPGPPALP